MQRFSSRPARAALCRRLFFALLAIALGAGVALAQNQPVTLLAGWGAFNAGTTEVNQNAAFNISLNTSGVIQTGSGLNNYLLVGVTLEGRTGADPDTAATISSVSWNGTGLSLACRAQHSGAGLTNSVDAEIWYLNAPSSYNGNVVVQTSGGTSSANYAQATAAVFANVAGLGTCQGGNSAAGGSVHADLTYGNPGAEGAVFYVLGVKSESSSVSIGGQAVGSGAGVGVFQTTGNTATGYSCGGNSGQTTGCSAGGTEFYAVGPGSTATASFASASNSAYLAIPFGSSQTAVTVTSLTATPSGNGNLVKLQTGREVHNLGFNVYREQNGQRVKLNSSLLAGSALLGGAATTFTAGHIRTWRDDPPPGASVSYYVEEVDLSGARTWYGPVVPAAEANPSSSADRASPAVALSSIGRTSTAFVPARPAALLPTPAADSGNFQTQWSLAAGQAVKLAVTAEGWYRVTQPQLIAAGLNPNVNPRTLQLYANGVEQPLLVEGASDGRFGSTDAIDFYGLPVDTIWSGTEQYWLVSGSGAGLTIGSGPGPGLPVGGPAAASSFPFALEWQPRTLYFAALLNGDADANSYFGPVLDSSDPLSQPLTLTHLATGAAGSSPLAVTLQGASSGAHVVSITVNGHSVGSMKFSDFNNSASTFQVPNADLLQGANTLGLTVTGGASDVSCVDTVLLTYPHTYAADNNSLRLTADSGRKVTVTGFTDSTIQVADITDPSSVSLVSFTLSAGAVTFTPQGGGTRTLLAVGSSRYATPAAIVANHPSSWHARQQGGDMVVIGHSSLLASAAPLAALRQSEGHKVQTIDVQDLYDEFNYGVESPYAIRDFLSTARQNWDTAPAYVLLFGNGTFDPRNYLQSGVPDLVAVKLIDATLLETASDDWFADFDNTGVPEMAIGRIPAESAAQATVAVNRLLTYDRSGGAWKSAALLVAGVDEAQGDNFEGFTATVKALLPHSLSVTQILAGSAPNAPADVLAQLNLGQALVNYVGHGSEQIWADGLLDASQAEALTNGPAVPFVLSMTCLNGYFQDVYAEALAKVLLTAPAGGAVAVWASSGLTDATPQSNINQAMVTALYGSAATTIGQAAMAAKKATTDLDVRHTWILFGDPAMKLQ
jgi:hypothetical protein